MSESNSVFVFSSFLLDAGQRSLSRDGQPVALTPKEFDTLLVLVEAGGLVVYKGELISRVWPDSFVGEGSLARNISVLRKALGEDVIETHRGQGYRITSTVEVTTSNSAAPSVDPSRNEKNNDNATGPAEVVIRETPRRWIPRAFIALAIGSLLLISAVAQFFRIKTAKAHVSTTHAAPLHSILIEKNGAIDPLDEGFRLHGPLTPGSKVVLYNRETNGWDRWRLLTDDFNYYYHPLNEREKEFALQHDWKLTCVCALEQGLGSANVDLGATAPRFDMVFLREGNRYFVALTNQISPKLEWDEKIEFPGIADVDHPHTYELRYDHVAQAASLWIDGVLRASDYRGHHQFLEDRGIILGTSIYQDATTGSFVVRGARFEAE